LKLNFFTRLKAAVFKMQIIDGEWIMNGTDPDDESCVHTPGNLLKTIERVGFLPLFDNEIEGFSVENLTDPSCWWCGDPDTDPWEWRITLTRTGKVAYGKFFGNKAGFISKKWFPCFANYRREGYDFDARYEDGKAGRREKLLMELFIPEGIDMWNVDPGSLAEQNCSSELYTFEMKEKAGFGKGGEKNFEGMLTRLQMQTYLTAKDFRPRLNKKGEEFGWPVALMTPPEYIWGYEFVTGGYTDTPEMSVKKIVKQMQKHFSAKEEQIKRIFK